MSFVAAAATTFFLFSFLSTGTSEPFSTAGNFYINRTMNILRKMNRQFKSFIKYLLPSIFLSLPSYSILLTREIEISMSEFYHVKFLCYLSACRFRSCLHLKSINNFIEQFVNIIISTGKSTRVEWKNNIGKEGKVLMLILWMKILEKNAFPISIRASHWIICRLENNFREYCVKLSGSENMWTEIDFLDENLYII